LDLALDARENDKVPCTVYVMFDRHNTISETEKVTNQKDTVIADLGAQAADAHAREQEVDATHKKLAVNLARVEEEAAQAKEDVKDLKKKLEKSKAASDKFMAGEAERRERACDEAANDLYVKLKREYDSSIGKVERLERFGRFEGRGCRTEGRQC
jgi:seryl-tRNA synthetase